MTLRQSVTPLKKIFRRKKVNDFLLNSRKKVLGTLRILNSVSNLQQNQNFEEEMSTDECADTVLTTQSPSKWRSVNSDSIASTWRHNQSYHKVAPTKLFST